MKRTVPAGLIDAINAGTCVAFVGAGFSSAAGLPPWKKLLRSLAAADVGPDLRHFVEKVTGSEQSSAHDLDRAAQLLSDHLGRPRFITGLKEQLVPSSLPPEMQQRLDWLHAIPFRAILTLNFDGVMKGAAAGSDAYLRILRRVRSHWWEEAFWSEGGSGPPTIKLHGDLLSSEEAERVVFTREDYRRRLYGDPSYATFLRAVFSTSTLLFLGVSFQDAYLNELRSEVLAMLGYDGQQHRGPVAYALLSDVDPAVVDHYHKHEGIEVLPFDSGTPPAYRGFDEWLESIHHATSPTARLGALLEGKRILWLDSTRDARDGAALLTDAATRYGRGNEPIVPVDEVDAALRHLTEAQRAGAPFDLVISYWRGSVTHAEGLTLLEEMRRRDLRSPVIIFAGDHSANERKRVALALGAQHYCVTFETLFRRMEEILAPASKTW